ncbi:proline-, glutamic acid- and leucine-rich protein 1 [Spodoptera frugiperda]|uniref:Proline-, glutamic acid- and leucine-rich protein 1 n=1 Tax=Spodoptera frugiperda TaxID=7108 RepID=A0A9R0DQJ3_SPOFR|nr:proline-, glutamic acid- and leucine-rich protein 1 [Spodoptera frugiperda]XP_050551261.1 proline-, glutamic acid- and leucine-rich protein 1 [Spodoptera frugiperda]
MKLEWAESESDYGLEEAAFYEGPPVAAPPPTKHVSFSLRLDLCDEGGGAADSIKTEPPEPEEPRAMQKVPSLSDLSDPEASLEHAASNNNTSDGDEDDDLDERDILNDENYNSNYFDDDEDD